MRREEREGERKKSKVRRGVKKRREGNECGKK